MQEHNAGWTFFETALGTCALAWGPRGIVAVQLPEADDQITQARLLRNSGPLPQAAPPPGSDIYMIARLWSFWPILELEKDKTYRLHLTSLDYNHGFSLQPANINIQIVPGYEHVITVTPNKAGTYSVVCNEFCGINHHTMVGRIYVK